MLLACLDDDHCLIPHSTADCSIAQHSTQGDAVQILLWCSHNLTACMLAFYQSSQTNEDGLHWTAVCRDSEALQSFAQDAYQCSLAYGPQDVRTSLAYYNLAKVFQGMSEQDKMLACCDQVACLCSCGTCPILLRLHTSSATSYRYPWCSIVLFCDATQPILNSKNKLLGTLPFEGEGCQRHTFV